MIKWSEARKRIMLTLLAGGAMMSGVEPLDAEVLALLPDVAPRAAAQRDWAPLEMRWVEQAGDSAETSSALLPLDLRIGLVSAGRRVALLEPEGAPDGQRRWVRAPVQLADDHLFVAQAAPVWSRSDRMWREHAAVLALPARVSVDGWRAPSGAPLSIEPLTRPYGLWAGGAVSRCGANQWRARFRPAHRRRLAQCARVDGGATGAQRRPWRVCRDPAARRLVGGVSAAAPWRVDRAQRRARAA
nr:hypothetical protein [Magnetofaba australis]